jgi:uncharacterized protein Yka (UPF0111/DUF47 family)
MEKSQALASLGQRGLLLPVWVKAALAANDRLKFYLSLLQTSRQHALHPRQAPVDLSHELAAAGLQHQPWLLDLPAGASQLEGRLQLPELDRLKTALHDDLITMARPVLESVAGDAEPHLRVQHWLDWLSALDGVQLDSKQIEQLTHGHRGGADSLHLLVMDLHKQINHLVQSLSSEDIDGAHVWMLDDTDRPMVSAFMRGLHRTAPLKFDHPGLDTAATRDGARLLLQNDIGTNDAHVLVIQIEALTITLTYSDLHWARLAFFQTLLKPLGAQWSVPESRVNADLNQGQAYTVGTAQFSCADTEALHRTLEGLGAQIVFLIDWNRARKRLLHFVDKAAAIELLTEAAQHEVGHMAWLRAGGEALIFTAMQSVGDGAFRIGDRLDNVLGEVQARHFLLDVMHLACDALLHGLPVTLVADETRLLLARQVRRRSAEFDLLDEHAAYCQALAQAVADTLSHGHDGLRDSAEALSARAKTWERQADHLVMKARELSERQTRWQPVLRLLGQADDVADALEEAAFLICLIADHHQKGWNSDVRKALSQLAQTVLQATQDHIRALAIARSLGSDSDVGDNDQFLTASWAVLHAERRCDELLRNARRILLAQLQDAASLMLANDLAMTLEMASDKLLQAGYGLRELAFNQVGLHS